LIQSSCANAVLPVIRDFSFVGTNAYWLPFLNTDDDIRKTLANISKTGITVVRTWAFNGANNCPVVLPHFLPFGQIDVFTVPDSGSWLLLLKDGNTTINTGPNGIQRLDKVIKIAKEYNIYLQFSLTNNWFPTVDTPPESCPLPRNYLSNSYGQYLILDQLRAFVVNQILYRRYGCLRQGVW
jgi:mannan endo-1,4-beta-mannosidase